MSGFPYDTFPDPLPATPGRWYGPRYWGPRYWGNRYWGTGQARPIPVYPDLLDAIVARLRMDAAVAAAVGGRVWQGAVGHDEALPYVEITDPHDAIRDGITTDGGYIRRGSYDINIYDEDPGDGSFNADDRVRAIAWDVVHALADAGLTFQRGVLVYLRPAGDPSGGEEDPDPGPNGLPVWRARVNMQYIVSGNYSN